MSQEVKDRNLKEYIDQGLSEEDAYKKYKQNKTESRLNPDTLISQGELDIVVDAKYYSSAETVMKSNHYQMLGYALGTLHSNHGKRAGKRKVTFVAPHRGAHAGGEHEPIVASEELSFKMQLPFTILGEKDIIKSKNIPTLQGISMEFPSPKVFNSSEESKKYYQTVGRALKKELDIYFSELQLN